MKKLLRMAWGVPAVVIMVLIAGLIISLDPDINSGGGYPVFKDSALPEIGSFIFLMLALGILIRSVLAEVNDYFDKDAEGDGTY